MNSFVKGDVVQIFGLNNQPDLNGQRGEVIDIKGERLAVKIDTKTVLIKPINLIAGSQWLGLQRKLWSAVEDSDYEKVKTIIKNGGDVNSCNQLKTTSLHRAVKANGCKSSVMNIIMFLINECDADITASDITGATVLHYAAASQFSEPVRFLLSKGAEVCPALNGGNRTPLHYCVMSELYNQEIYDALVEAGADPQSADIDGETPSQLRERRLRL